MVDIFSSFDPFINIFYQFSSTLFWVLLSLSFTVIGSSYWVAFNYTNWVSSYSLGTMNDQSLRTLSHHIKGFSSILVPLFVMLIMVNFLGLLPYSFSYSSHMVFSLMLGLPLWCSLVVSSLILMPKNFMAGLLPSGAPDWLNPFLVMVESISILVRPITLSVRLVANMSAGHIVLSLIGIYTSYFMFTSSISFILLLTIQVGYIMFEMGICLIQAYIFCLLLTLYADDHTH